MSVFPRSFCFIAFSGVSQRWEFKNTTKIVLQKKSCRKVFCKKIDKNPKPIFLDLFYDVRNALGRFSVRGVQKRHLKTYIPQKKPALVLFWPLTHPPTTGVTGFFFLAFGGPLNLEPQTAAISPQISPPGASVPLLCCCYFSGKCKQGQ
jgi:hypothetical protein